MSAEDPDEDDILEDGPDILELEEDDENPEEDGF
jgi:hypothetical protein